MFSKKQIQEKVKGDKYHHWCHFKRNKSTYDKWCVVLPRKQWFRSSTFLLLIENKHLACNFGFEFRLVESNLDRNGPIQEQELEIRLILSPERGSYDQWCSRNKIRSMSQIWAEMTLFRNKNLNLGLFWALNEDRMTSGDLGMKYAAWGKFGLKWPNTGTRTWI